MFAFKFQKPDAAARYHKKLTKDTAYREGENRRFALAPPAENMLRAAILESGWMMNNITLRDVNAQSGNAINIGASELHTGRTAGGRFRKKVTINGSEFWLSETDTCASISYGEMADIYNIGAAGDFDKAMDAFFAEALALDMLRTGFNGMAIADTTDPETCKKGEDVNIGWHALAKQY
ncbi:P2 family phage major capsid protein, partial [Cronobacter sakazakii]|nr:P2 family phage major capsid protein [Cronobacter sakazakii]